MDISEIIGGISVKCSVCGCDEVWLKEIRNINGKVGIVYKCNNCAYVNLSNIYVTDVGYPDYIPSFVDYNVIGKLVRIPYKEENCDERYIGHDFWIKDGKVIRKEVKCPKCGEIGEVRNLSPFIRDTLCGRQYRLDIICSCSKCGTVYAFGVHISEKEFDKFVGGI